MAPEDKDRPMKMLEVLAVALACLMIAFATGYIVRLIVLGLLAS
jgi:hypothetical protein